MLFNETSVLTLAPRPNLTTIIVDRGYSVAPADLGSIPLLSTIYPGDKFERKNNDKICLKYESFYSQTSRLVVFAGNVQKMIFLCIIFQS